MRTPPNPIMPRAGKFLRTLPPPQPLRGAVRIVGGHFRRTVLPVLPLAGLRPTPHRVRETLFNWLGQDLTGWRCVDAFAGTGALGLEAASRGASCVVMMEREAALVRNLNAQQQKLQAPGVRVEHTDARQGLALLPPEHFDLVFLDPPYQAHMYEVALSQSLRILAPGARLYLECDREWGSEEFAQYGFTRIRYGKAASVHYHLATKNQGPRQP